MSWKGFYKESISYVSPLLKLLNTRPSQPALNRELKKDGPCFVCKEMTNYLEANPGLWPIYLPHIDGQGKHRFYHMGCLYPILNQQEINRELVEALERIKERLFLDETNYKCRDGGPILACLLIAKEALAKVKDKI